MAEKVKSKRKRKKIVRLTVTIIVVAAVVAAGIIYLPGILKRGGGDSTQLVRTTAVVERGVIARSMGVSSSIVPSDTEDAKPVYGGEVLEVAAAEGEYVEEGTMILRLSTEITDDMVQAIEDQIEVLNEQIDSLNDVIEDSYSAIDSHNETIAGRKDDIADLRMDITELEDDIAENEALRDNLNIYSPLDGTVFNVLVSEGDMVFPGSAIAVITDPAQFEVEFPFPASYLDEEVLQVRVHYLGMDFDAQIASQASYTYYDSHRRELVDTVLTFSSAVSIAPGATVTASMKTDANSYFIHDGAAPYYAKTETVLSEVSGEVLSVFMNHKQPVGEGDLIAVIDSGQIDDTTESLNNQISTVNDQIEALQDANDNSTESISQINENIADYREDILDVTEDINELNEDLAEAHEGYSEAEIVAVFDGYVTDLTVEEGDEVSANQKLFTLVSMETPKLYLTIDELDIPEISEGLAAEVTIDALTFTETNPVPATVTGIALSGNAQGGVTTYTVTIELNESVEGLLPGMSGTGTIFISRSENTLFVPIEAVTIKDGTSYVWITTAEADGKEGYDKTGYDKDNLTDKTGYPDKTDASGKTGGKAAGGRPGLAEKDTSKMTEEQKARYEEYLKKQGMSGESKTDDGSGTISSLEEYYSGAKMVEVTTGIHNETQIEILTGLKEGQMVLLPPVYLSSSAGTEGKNDFNMGTARKAMGGFGK